MEYEQIGERTALSNLYSRWTEFMKYVNRKGKTIAVELLREYSTFLANVALRFGGIDAILRAPEIPNEAIGQYVRDYETLLIEWSKKLAELERMEARFHENKRNAAKADDATDDKRVAAVNDGRCDEVVEDKTQEKKPPVVAKVNKREKKS